MIEPLVEHVAQRLDTDRRVEVRERLAFDEAGQPVTDDPNLNGSLAFYRLGRK